MSMSRIEVAKDMPISCEVIMDGQGTKSDDFVAVLSCDSGDASIMYNTDVLTLGMALKMVASAFVAGMKECTIEERDEITAILGGAFIQNVTEQEEAKDAQH